jgi:hypothetical protein
MARYVWLPAKLTTTSPVYMSLEDPIESLAKILYRAQDQRLVGELVDFEVLFGCEGNGWTLLQPPWKAAGRKVPLRPVK